MTKSHAMTVRRASPTVPTSPGVFIDAVSGVILQVIGQARVIARSERGGVMFKSGVEASPRQIPVGGAARG